MSLSSLAVGDEAVITSIDGDVRFLSRITSIGLTPGCKVMGRTVPVQDACRRVALRTWELSGK